MTKKVVSILMTLIIIATMVSVTGITVSAYSIPDEAGFAAKLSSLRNQFPNGGYYSGTYYENGTAKAWECHGYALECFEQVFGIQYYNSGFYNRRDYTMGTIYAGDVVRTGNDSHTIFITKVDGDRIYYTDANYWPAKYGSNYVRWDVSYSYSELKAVFTYKVHVPDNYLLGNPAPENLRVGVSGSQAYMNWDWDGNAAYYNVKIWKNKVYEGDPYRIVWSVKSNNYGFALPKGTYQAYVDACNDNSGYCKMSNVITFTVGDSVVNLNVDVSGSYVGLTWNRDNNAQYYNLKIWKNYVWEGEAYETVWSIKDNSRYLTLPKGTYQAFVDAVNENTGYCSMSSVVAFTVGDSVVNLNASVSDPQVSFSWNQDSNAQYYNLKIWKDYVWEGEEYQFVWSINDTNISLNFPTGTYQAFVDAVNEKTGYCLMSSVVTFTIEQGIEPITSILGDTNLDGRINIRDVTAIQRHIAELDMFTEEQLAAADTNGDGKVDITDATYLQMYLAEYDGIVLGKQTTT